MRENDRSPSILVKGWVSGSSIGRAQGWAGGLISNLESRISDPGGWMGRKSKAPRGGPKGLRKEGGASALGLSYAEPAPRVTVFYCIVFAALRFRSHRS